MRPLIVYIAASADGYIARPDDGLDWLEAVQAEGEDYGYQAFTDTVDTVLLGRRTYDLVLGMGVPFPHAGKQTYVLTRTERPGTDNLTFYTGDLKALVTDLKNRPGKAIFCDGGAEIVTELLRHDLVDEFYLSLIPVLLGDGIRLFRDGRPEAKLTLAGSRAYASGLVQLHYQRLREA